MIKSVEASPGIYGKMPSNGDFVTRRLPAAFVEPWDLWLQDAIADSRDQLGEHWLSIYLTSPIWRFVLSPGVAGQRPWVGALMPSVDRVARYFPLTLACALPTRSNPIRCLCGCDAWFSEAESLLLSCLQDGFDLESFDLEVLRLGVPPIKRSSMPTDLGRGMSWRLPLSPVQDVSEACPDLLDQALAELCFGYSLWWSEGSDLVEPSLLVCQGLPATQAFAALLDGGWRQRGWQEQAPLPAKADPSGVGNP